MSMYILNIAVALLEHISVRTVSGKPQQDDTVKENVLSERVSFLNTKALGVKTVNVTTDGKQNP